MLTRNRSFKNIQLTSKAISIRDRVKVSSNYRRLLLFLSHY